MHSTYVIETRQWNLTWPIERDRSGLDLSIVAGDLLVAGMSQVEQGKIAEAEQALSRLKHWRKSEGIKQQHSHDQAAEVMELELDAVINIAKGKTKKGLELLQGATELEDSMRFAYGPPDPVKPSHELLGEILLQLDRPQEAKEQFELALSNTPKRALSLLGLARSARKSDDHTTAQTAMEELRKIWHKADPDLQELKK